MSTRSTKRFKFGVVAFVLVVTLPMVAGAHTIGRLQVIGSSGGSSVGVGPSGGGNDFCGVPGYFTGGAKAAATGGAVTVLVSRDPDVHNPDCRQLPAGEYRVNFLAGAQFVIDDQGNYVSPTSSTGWPLWQEYPSHCRYQGTQIGTIQVGHTGNGWGAYDLPDNLPVNGPNDAGVICIHDFTSNSNFAPLAIVP